jgi:hypothetical protein
MNVSNGDDHPHGATMRETAPRDRRRELAHREGDGVEVTLLWDKRRDRLAVLVFSSKTGYRFELEAPRERALDVFYHPFSYAASRTAPDADQPLAA